MPKFADAVDEERLFPGVSRAGFLKPEPNEQIATQAHQFPKDEIWMKLLASTIPSIENVNSDRHAK